MTELKPEIEKEIEGMTLSEICEYITNYKKQHNITRKLFVGTAPKNLTPEEEQYLQLLYLEACMSPLSYL